MRLHVQFFYGRLKSHSIGLYVFLCFLPRPRISLSVRPFGLFVNLSSTGWVGLGTGVIKRQIESRCKRKLRVKQCKGKRQELSNLQLAGVKISTGRQSDKVRANPNAGWKDLKHLLCCKWHRQPFLHRRVALKQLDANQC